MLARTGEKSERYDRKACGCGSHGLPDTPHHLQDSIFSIGAGLAILGHKRPIDLFVQGRPSKPAARSDSKFGVGRNFRSILSRF